MGDIRRRAFITLLGGAAAWAFAAQAQQGEMRRIGMLLGSTATDRPDLAAFLKGLQELGWTDGRNVRIAYRSGLGNAADTRKHAEELVALAPDVILMADAPQAAGLNATGIVFWPADGEKGCAGPASSE